MTQELKPDTFAEESQARQSTHESPPAQEKAERVKAEREAKERLAKKATEGSAAGSEFDLQMEVKKVESDMHFLLHSFYELKDWSVNTVEIFALEMQMALKAIPELIFARLALVPMAMFSWVLIALSIFYGIYILTESLGAALVLTTALQLFASFLFVQYIKKIASHLKFSQTREEFAEIKRTFSNRTKSP